MSILYWCRHCTVIVLCIITVRGIILAVKKAGHLNIKKWLANTLREHSLASQSEHVPQSCFYV